MKHHFWKTLEPSWNLFWKNRKLIPLAVAFDLLFYYFLIRLHFEVFKVVAVKVKALTGIMQEAYQSGPQAMQNFVASNAEFIATYKLILQNITLFLLGVLGLWIVFKGANWYIANHSNKKTKLVPYAKNFLGLSFIWILFFVILLVVTLSLISHATNSPLPVINEQTAQVIGMVLIWLMGYFMYISYAQKGMQCFKFGWKHKYKLFPAYLVASLIAFVCATVPVTIAQTHRIAAVVVIVLVALPALAFSRLYIVKAVQDLKQK